MSFKLILALTCPFLWSFNNYDASKILFRLDKIQFRGSKLVKSRMEFENYENGSFAVNATFKVLQPFDKELQIFTFRINQDKSDHDYSLAVWETKIDLCRIMNGVRSSIVAKVLFENALNASSRELVCPIPAGNYNFTNLLITNKYLPPFPNFMFPDGEIQYSFKCTVKGILNNQKKYVRMYDYALLGRAYSSDKFNSSI